MIKLGIMSFYAQQNIQVNVAYYIKENFNYFLGFINLMPQNRKKLLSQNI